MTSEVHNGGVATMNLPEPIATACAPLFDVLPLDEAMPHLTGSHPQHTALVENILSDPALAARPDLTAALWLYADDLDRSHTLSQSLENPTGAYWHGIMHRREGDFSNSHYWMRRCSEHPLRRARPDLDADTFIDEVAASRGQEIPALLAKQREEWQALFVWCAENP